ncbi:MAG: LamG domain-containing protein [Kiritimatiellaeota bacterium]|nr:LamG domain-containing protein [Kiritimatiellota bacterium]
MKRDRFNISIVRVTVGLLLAFATGYNTPAADFPQGLMLHFNFEQAETGGVITDRSGRNNNGRAFGAKWTATGKQGGAYEFALSNNYIQVTNTPSLNATQATFAVWFKTSKTNAIERYILDKTADRGYALSIAGESKAKDGKPKGKLCAGVNGHYCLSDSVVTDGTWHHGAATFDGENLKLYVDGQLQKQVVAWHGAIAANTNDLTIGMNRSSPLPQEQGQSFGGAIDEVMIFNHALSNAEVNVVIASVKPKFTKDQVARRLIELKELFDRGLILKDFYDRKVQECEVTP